MTFPESADRPRPFRVLVLGGYGHFGGRICARLASHAHIQLVVGGRNQSFANEFIAGLKAHPSGMTPEPLVIDHTSPDLSTILRRLNIDLVIHTCGPFQGQSYHVAESAIEAKCHYIDLADAREFVSGFRQLDEQAKSRDVSLITGASTVPGVSSAVVTSLRPKFRQINTIRICITPGNQTPRGLATLKSVLTYCGKPFQRLDKGKWTTIYGWQDLKTHYFPRLGRRWLGACDVPDLELLPETLPKLQSVSFHAALELTIWQWGLWLLSWLSRMGLVSDWSRSAGIFKSISDKFNNFGTPHGGMFVEITGLGANGSRAKRTWYLTALNGHGPEIPVVPAVILADRLASGKALPVGAFSSINMMTLAEFAQAVEHLDISWEVLEE